MSDEQTEQTGAAVVAAPTPDPPVERAAAPPAGQGPTWPLTPDYGGILTAARVTPLIQKRIG